MIPALIVGCEVGFWVLILAGLVFRYMLHLKKTGRFLLYLTPVVDLLLLITVVIDLLRGGTASFAHGLAAVYLGFSIVYGHRMIRWADMRFAHRFAGGPAPVPKVKHGRAHARRERIGWLLHLLAWAIGCVFLVGMIVIVNDVDRTVELSNVMRWWSTLLGIDFLISFSYTIWPRKEKEHA
ncbi:hypothetical protein EDM56_19770 [Brevibacillus fluminis]|uniref:YmcC n=1 Tax=Brevibacillus fluminis TaxID=511487 RepID=A0A3M8DAY5_9BACL|nr:hypothetical protein [Brevibacillus fluminis]RNB85148.1 hypothetical protein EDM56_19770 [Brevibacillus fluminis]